MSAKARAIEALTREVRACFNRLRALGDALHHDLGITAAMRAVMEALADGGAQTVPTIARAKSVSRQHIQVLANALIEAGLVASRPNPEDGRSPLIELTAKGKRTFAAMRDREKTVLHELADALDRNDVETALAALRALHAQLDRLLNQGGDND